MRFHSFLILCIMLGFYACDFKQNKGDKILPSSSGKYGEVLVVIDSTYEKGKTGEVLRNIFYKAVEALPQREPMFRMATVDPSNLKSILKRSRNILRISIAENNKSNVQVRENIWAKNQLLIDIAAPSDEKAANLLNKNKKEIRAYFNEIEIQRLQDQYSIKPQKDLMDIISTRFSLNMIIPPAFVMMDSSGNGLWLKKEQQVGQHTILQGLIIYELPYDNDSVFTREAMIESRNNFCKTHVQGARDSSYMVVYEEYEPIKKEVNLNEKYAMNFRGLWNMKNDFMGGPYIHYTFVDEKRQKVMHVDGFVYAPKFNKREYLRELKAVLESIKL